MAHEVNDVISLDLKTSSWIKLEVDTSRSSVELISPGRMGGSRRPEEEMIEQNTSLSSVRNSAIVHDISIIGGRGAADLSRVKALISPKYISGFVPRTFDKHKKTAENFAVEKTQQIISPKKEQIRKQNLMKKMMMLSEFEVSDKERKDFEEKSPTTEAMKNSIKDLHFDKYKNNHLSSAGSQKSIIHHMNRDVLENSISTKNLKEENLIEEKKPCARDGFSSNLFENKLIIFGGDRHLMPFHDVYVLDLERAFLGE